MDLKRVLIVGENDTMLERISMTLSMSFSEGSIACHCGAFHALKHIGKDTDLVVMCHNGPVDRDLYESLGKLTSFSSVLLIYKVLGFQDLKNLIELGVTGFINTNESIDVIIKGIVRIIDNRTFLCQDTISILVGRVNPPTQINILSKRETQVLGLLSKGNTYKEISEELVISIDTIKSHVYNIYRKLNVRNKTEAANKVKLSFMLMN